MADRTRASDADRNSERLLRVVLERIAAVLWSTDTELRFTFSSGAGLAALNLQPDQVTGMTLWEYFHTNDADFFPIVAHRRALQGESVSYEHDWAGRVYQSRVSPLRNRQQEIIGCVGVAQDITERKQAEKRLQESQRELTIRNEIARIFLTAPDDEIYAQVLQAVLEAMESQLGGFGYIDEQGDLVCPSLAGNAWDQCRVAEKAVVFPHRTWQGMPGRALTGKKTICSNKPFSLPEGHVPVVRALDVPIVHQGELIGNLLVGNKETDYDEKDVRLLETVAAHVAPILQARLQRDRKERDRRRVEEEKDSLLKAMETTREGIIITSADGKITYTNDAMDGLFGYEKGELLGKHPSILNAGPDPQAIAAQVFDGIKNHGFWEGDIRNKKKDGTEFISHAMAGAVRDEDGRVLSCVSAQHDITGRKRAEEALKKAHDELEIRVRQRTAELAAANRQLKQEIEDRKWTEKALHRAERLASIGTLAAGIAHEINNPLGAIGLYAGIAMLAEDHPEIEETPESCLENIQEQVARCSRIVKGILQFAREEEPERWPGDLGYVARRAQDLTGAMAAEKQVSVLLKLGDHLPRAVINPTEMEQVFVNLISNAIQASGAGDRVILRIEPTPKAVRVLVEDQGCGMTEDQVSRVFDPFYTTRQQEGGTGLGMSITYGIVEQLGGTIDVQSRPGEGTTVVLELPLNPPTAQGLGHGEDPRS